MSTWIEAGGRAPDFALPADDGTTVALKDLRGRMVVVYFYPKDDTPGCTREACAFRDRKKELARAGVVVLGVSADDVRSHAKFRDKYGLNFPLLADVDHRTAEAFGAWQEKSLYGRKFWGIQRSTFLIDAEGIVRRVWRKVSVDGHDDEVLAAVREPNADATTESAPKKSRPKPTPADGAARAAGKPKSPPTAAPKKKPAAPKKRKP